MSTYRVTASVPAPRGWDGATGEWPTVVLPQCRPAQDEKKTAEPNAAPWWAGTGANRATAVVLALLAVAITGLYWLACELAGHPAPWRVLLIVLATVLGVGAVGAVLHGWTQQVLTRAVEQHVTRAVERHIGPAVATLEETSGRKAAILEQIAARMGRLECLVAQRLDRLEQRVEDVEAVEPGVETALAERFGVVAELLVERINGIEERQVEPEVLRGIAAWAAQLDRRLTEIQRGMRGSGPAAPQDSNGNRDSGSPLELSDEALRGYFMGFYDRERGDGEASASP